MKKIYLLLILLSISIFNTGFYKGNCIEKPCNYIDSLRNDFSVFRNVLTEKYPSLYRYINKEKMDFIFDSCYQSINQQTTEQGFIKNLKYVLSAIKDGHLYCGASDTFEKYIDEKAQFFPLKINFINEQAFVFNSNTAAIQRGSEIISINGIPVNEIKETLFRYIVSDGYIDSKKYHILNNSFYYYYFLVYGEKLHFDIIYKTKTGKLETIKAEAVLIDKIPNNNKEGKGLLTLDYYNDIALLNIKTFDIGTLTNHDLDFEIFLEKSFREINEKKIGKLIIDLRDNGGGRDLYGSLFYSYLTNHPFKYYKSLGASTKQLPYYYFKRNNSSYNDLSDSMLNRTGDNYFELSKNAHDNLQLIQPQKNNYTGKVWFLINGKSFSTTAEFCAIAKSENRGVFIGNETGGSYDGNTSGYQIETILPFTKIVISTGTIKYEMDVKKPQQNGRGIVPDYNISPSIEDLINEKDIQLEFALKKAGE